MEPADWEWNPIGFFFFFFGLLNEQNLSMKENESKYTYGPLCSVVVFYLNYHNDSKSILAPFNPFSTLQPKGSFENSHRIMLPIFLKSLNDVHCSSNKE